jgi:hypothetical protein
MLRMGAMPATERDGLQSDDVPGVIVEAFFPSVPVLWDECRRGGAEAAVDRDEHRRF